MTLSLSIQKYRWRMKSQMSDNDGKTGNEQKSKALGREGRRKQSGLTFDGLPCRWHIIHGFVFHFLSMYILHLTKL